MRVLHLNSGLFFGGGLERVIVDLMSRNDKVTNYLCIINNQWDEKHLDELDQNKVLLCNREIGTKNPIANLMPFYKIYKFIKRNKINLIHCHNSFSLKYAYFFKKFLNIKVVYTVHEPTSYNEELNKYPIDKYIAISKAVYKTINKFVSNEKIELIYNGINLNKFKNSKNYILRDQKEIRIACVARLVPEIKGQDILLKALNILNNDYKYTKFKCFFAGTSLDQKTMFELNELTRKFQLESNVEFMGNVDKIEELYAKTDVFILPSRYEGFGLVVVEALASGCSVVVSKLDGPLEIVKENEQYGLYFEKENFKELADKIYRLVSDKEYRKQYSNNEKTLQYIKEEYSLEKMIISYNKIYRSCLGAEVQ